MPKIFISYRRDDSELAADPIYAELQRRFGNDNVFLDVGTMPLGVDFRTFLREQVALYDVVLVLIGPKWADILRARAAEPNDFVRIEIERALQLGKIVIPVLVARQTTMPDFTGLPASLQDLRWCHAALVRRVPDFAGDVQRLGDGIVHALAQSPVVPTPPR